jgi:hypothetical protein
VGDWKNYQLLEEIEGLCDINKADKTGLLFSLQSSRTLTFQGHSCHSGTKFKQRVTVLITCNEGGSDKLPL